VNSSPDPNQVGGDDVYVWGRNFDGELGNGKKSSIAIPLYVSLDPPKASKGTVDPVKEDERLMLMERKAKEVKDLKGKVWKKGVKVRQCVAAGYGTSVVYWKIMT
jgi:hypothetical protein